MHESEFYGNIFWVRGGLEATCCAPLLQVEYNSMKKT